MHGYVLLQDNRVDQTPWHRKLAWVVCSSILSFGVLFASCRIIAGSLSAPSVVLKPPPLQSQLDSKYQSGAINLANIVQGGMGSRRARQSGLRPRFPILARNRL